MKFLFAALFLFLLACEEGSETKTKIAARVESVPGQIMIFNSCGITGAATEARDVLRTNGFDVLSAETDPKWSNYEETVVAVRNPHWIGHERLKATLDTENFIVLEDALSGNIGATIFLGKDYKKVLRIKRG